MLRDCAQLQFGAVAHVHHCSSDQQGRREPPNLCLPSRTAIQCYRSCNVSLIMLCGCAQLQHGANAHGHNCSCDQQGRREPPNLCLPSRTAIQCYRSCNVSLIMLCGCAQPQHGANAHGHNCSCDQQGRREPPNLCLPSRTAIQCYRPCNISLTLLCDCAHLQYGANAHAHNCSYDQ